MRQNSKTLNQTKTKKYKNIKKILKNIKIKGEKNMVEGMEFGERIYRKSGEAVTTALAEGGGVALGFLAASGVGNLIEKYLKDNITANSPQSDKVIAWLANNGPKFVAWYGMNWAQRNYNIDPAKNMGNLMFVDAKKAVVASAFVDSAIRLFNHGAPGSGITIGGYKILGANTPPQVSSSNPQSEAVAQQLIRENSSLRGQLNQALSKLASIPSEQNRIVVNAIPQPQPQPQPQPHVVSVVPQSQPNDVKYGTMPTRGNPKYGTMPVDETSYQKKFGNMSDMTLDGEAKTLGAMFNFD